MKFFQSSLFKAWVILPKVTALISIIGSSFILHDVLRKENRKQKLKITTNWIVTLLSICDIIYSFIGYFLGTWMVPKELPGPNWENAPFLAAGNQATCTFQGFVTFFFSGASTALNTTLAITYLLVVRYGWKDRALQKPLMAFSLMVVPVLISLGYFLWPLVDQAYNWDGAWMCTIGHAPTFCNLSPLADCVRGLHADAIEYGSMIYTLICFACIFLSTMGLYYTVLTKEMAMDRFAVDPSQVSRTHSKRVAWQGIWYAGSFFITYFFSSLGFFYVVKKEFIPEWLVTLQAILLPLQGFFNAIVYFRPRWGSQRRQANNGRTSSRRFSAVASRVSANARRFWGIGSILMSRNSTGTQREETQREQRAFHSSTALANSAAAANINPSKKGSTTSLSGASLELVENEVVAVEANANEAKYIPDEVDEEKEEGNTQVAE